MILMHNVYVVCLVSYKFKEEVFKQSLMEALKESR